MILDMGGTEIRVGDYICYGRVTRLIEAPEGHDPWKPPPNQLRVHAVTHEPNDLSRELVWKILNKGREISLASPDRMVCLYPEQVPVEARAKLGHVL